MAQIPTWHVLFTEVNFYLYEETQGNLIAVAFASSTTDDQARQHRTLKQTNDRAHMVDGKPRHPILVLNLEENFK
jgi:hypothetical protein